MKRRKFLKRASLTGIGVAVGTSIFANTPSNKLNEFKENSLSNTIENLPIVISTWNVPNATKKAGILLEEGSRSIDAIEKGCMIEEADLNNQSVGNGGHPDRDGHVTLDACIMDKNGNYGSVVYMQNIVHAIAVARKVMEDTPHVILAGKGAEEFAISKGFKKTNLLTEASKKAWEEWKKESNYQPLINIENHDTIGMLAID